MTLLAVKYICVVRFPISHIYNKVKDRQILLHSLTYTSLDTLFYFKKEAVLYSYQITNLFSKENVSFLIKRLHMYGWTFCVCEMVCLFILKIPRIHFCDFFMGICYTNADRSDASSQLGNSPLLSQV